MNRSKGAFLFSFFITLNSIFSQNYFFDNYGVIQDLEQSTVYSILQDDNDFIWLGTRAGVSIFNGTGFENKTIQEGLAPKNVRHIYKDKYGRIWLGHYDGGITVYEDETFHIVSFTNTEIKSDITSFVEDTLGNLWITTSGSGIFKVMDYDNGFSFETKQFIGDKLSDFVYGSLLLKNGTLLFIGSPWIVVYDPVQDNFEPFIVKGLDVNFQPIELFEDSKDNIWIGTHNGGLYRFNQLTLEVEYYDDKDGLNNSFISALTEDIKGNLWIGTWGGGISCLKPDGEVINYNSNNGLQDDNIYCIYEDREGNILIGTNEHGFSIFKGAQFKNYTADYTTKNSLPSDQINSILQDRYGIFWFGTKKGLCRYDPYKKLYRTFNYSSHNIPDNIVSVKDDPFGNLWLGTNGNGVFSYNLKTGRFDISFRLNSSLPQLRIIRAMEADKYGNLWIGTDEGLVHYDIKKDYPFRYTQSYGLPGNIITCLYLDSDETLWIGAQSKGVGTNQNHKPEFKIIEQLKDITPIAFVEDTERNIWIATQSSGVIVFSNNKIVKKLTINDGLLSNMVVLLNADKNNIYVGTQRGLNIYEKKTGNIYTYTRKNGFVGIENKPNATIIDRDSNIWFGTVAGAIQYDPSEESRERIQPATYIRNILVNNKPRKMVSGTKLMYFENKITFEYYCVSLSDPYSVKYQYMLEGEDTDWQSVTDKTDKEYQALGYGEYTFKVRAKNNFGIWNEEPASFHFIINKPFYKTAWFILTCIISGFIIIFLYIKIRERNLIREKRVLEETVKERTHELQEKKDELEVINKDITDSIQYAQRIQFAMLPPGSPYKDSFVLFMPKDIVSGDFYWFQTIEELEFMAAVDCTGHGVPGAFVSMIGYNTLDKIVKEYHITKPSEILNKLNEQIIISLHQKKSEEEFDNVKDGMDLSLVCYNSKTSKLQYAGAYNSLILVRNDELIETKADRVAIGYSLETEFTNHEFNIEDGDSIYMFSDGFADQFGGPNLKKYKIAQFKRDLIDIQNMSMSEQKKLLEKKHLEWKGKLEQIDDIIVIGRKF